MPEIILPPQVGIVRVAARRERAEVTNLRFAYWVPTRENPDGTRGGWTYDRNDLVIPNHPMDVGHAFADPAPFTPPRLGTIRLLVSGSWSNGSNWLGIPKAETVWYADRIELLFYTGLAEGWNTRVALFLGNKIAPGQINGTIVDRVLTDVDGDGHADPEWD